MLDAIQFKAGYVAERFKQEFPNASGFMQAKPGTTAAIAFGSLAALAGVVALVYFGATGQLNFLGTAIPNAFNHHVLPGLKTGWNAVSRTFTHKVGPWMKGAANTVAESMSKNTPAWITAASAAGALTAGGAGGYFIARKTLALPAAQKEDV